MTQELTPSKRSFENPVNLPIKIDNGCKGCGGEWGSRDFSEGKCIKCKRCLNCCGDKSVKYSCAWKYEDKWAGSPRRFDHERRSERATEAYIRNTHMLYEHRRMF